MGSPALFSLESQPCLADGSLPPLVKPAAVAALVQCAGLGHMSLATLHSHESCPRLRIPEILPPVSPRQISSKQTWRWAPDTVSSSFHLRTSIIAVLISSNPTQSQLLKHHQVGWGARLKLLWHARRSGRMQAWMSGEHLTFRRRSRPLSISFGPTSKWKLQPSSNSAR